MLHIIAKTKNAELLKEIPLDRVFMDDILWYWIDFEAPTAEESALLSTKLKFDELPIEDCLEHLERPKVDYYESYNFFIVHALNQKTLDPIEVDMFVGENYIVTFCKIKLQEIESARQKILNLPPTNMKRPTYLAYIILDKIVDNYFPAVYRTEDMLNDISNQVTDSHIHNLIDKVFEIRTDLLKLKHTVDSMKELLYRVLQSSHITGFKENVKHFNDIYDHLLRISDIIQSNRELTADVRDNYISLNSHKMNKIMTVLTIISSVFIPLTFIVGIYGMNFDNMPELHWKYGYFIVLGIMVLIGILMVWFFKRKGWLDLKK